MSVTRPWPGNRSRPRFVVAPRVFRAPEGPAAREARRPHCVRRRVSKPARALRSLRRPPHQGARSLIGGSARRLVVRPGPATAHRHRGRSLRRPSHLWDLVCWRVDWCVVSKPGQALLPPTETAARPLCRPAISHVIPLWLVQTLNLYRWNCSVFERSRKMTVGNYVRLLLGWLSPSLSTLYRSRALWSCPAATEQFRMQFL